MNFAEKVIGSKKKQIYKLQEKTAEGKPIWFIMHIFKHKLVAFLTLGKGQNYKLADYGKILSWGYGMPSEETLEEIRKKYS